MSKPAILFSLSFVVWLTGCAPTTVKSNVREFLIKDQVFQLTIADSPALRQTGLADRDQLALDAGMLFIFPDQQVRRFWMKNMKFNIDIIWLADGQVVGWQQNVPKDSGNIDDSQLPRYSSPVKVNQVLELPANSVEILGIKSGEQLIPSENLPKVAN